MAFVDTKAELADLHLKWQRQRKILQGHDDLLTECDECGIYFFNADEDLALFDHSELQLQTLPCHECCLCEECRAHYPLKSCLLCPQMLCRQCAGSDGLCDTCARNSLECEVCESPFLIENKECFICECGHGHCAKCTTSNLTSCAYCVETDNDSDSPLQVF